MGKQDNNGIEKYIMVGNIIFGSLLFVVGIKFILVSALFLSGCVCQR